MLDKTTTLKYTNIIVAFVVLCTMLFAATKGYFRADDFAHLETHIFEVMKDPATIITKSEFSGHYRPMVKVFWWVSYPFFGLRPFGYFVVIIAIFLLTTFMFSILTRMLTGNTLGSYIAVLLLLLQANTYLYTIRWIGAVTNVLSAFFVVVMLLFYVKSTRATSRAYLYYFLSLTSFGLGLMTREIFLVLFPVLVVYDFLFLWRDAPDKRKFLRKKLLSYTPFLVLMIIYVSVRNVVAGSNPLSGAPTGYTFTLGFYFLDSLLFFGFQLGYLPAAIFFLSFPSLRSDKVRLDRQELRLVVFSVFFALIAISPLLFFKWTSPTWLYLPVFGTTLAMTILFQRVFVNASKRRGELLFYGTLVWAIAGTFLLFFKLSEARFWEWGTRTQSVIEQVQTHYPELPHGATLCFIDKSYHEQWGVEGLFRSWGYLGAALRIWYDDSSLRACIVDKASSVETALREKGGAEILFVSEYDKGLLLDRTNWFRDLSGQETLTSSSKDDNL